jgi:hypothetical protein
MLTSFLFEAEHKAVRNDLEAFKARTTFLLPGKSFVRKTSSPAPTETSALIARLPLNDVGEGENKWRSAAGLGLLAIRIDIKNSFRCGSGAAAEIVLGRTLGPGKEKCLLMEAKLCELSNFPSEKLFRHPNKIQNYISLVLILRRGFMEAEEA